MSSSLALSINQNNLRTSPSYRLSTSNGLFELFRFIVSRGTTIIDSTIGAKKRPTVLGNQLAINPSEALSSANSHEVGTNPSVDLQQLKNRQIIEQMGCFQDNWNGYGAAPFSSDLLTTLEKIINGLYKQPKMMPTARNSAVLQYDFKDNTILAFEVFPSYVSEVLVPNGDYSHAQSKIIRTNFISSVNQLVRAIDESDD